ncbi:TIGR03943 family putative permease subunit [Leucobacter tardus]|uniref:TIGR03943 family protein n=1 Tax=Leucobacter tardus TaxID=501483 RepID=A0A939QGT7_9MICO|nr:TIGR03943 family protein [Leucobacter tardus]MBO2988624.1 TIGR03943 family protein [Leucobacter tardus]
MTHWRGLVLSAIGIAATLSLALSGRLDWYIHPRYTVFTVTMSLLGAVVGVLAVVVLASGDRRRRRAQTQAQTVGADAAAGSDRPRALALVSAGVLVVGLATALLIIPPATLSAATAGQREMNASISPGGEAPIALDDVDDVTELDVKQWSLLLRQQGGDEALGRTADLVGFVMPAEGAPDDVFYVARFSVTCCTIDAQPVGVPVYAPGWEDDFGTDDWVRVTGVFAANPDPDGAHPTVLMPAESETVEMPEDPYVH